MYFKAQSSEHYKMPTTNFPLKSSVATYRFTFCRLSQITLESFSPQTNLFVVDIEVFDAINLIMEEE